MSRTRLFFSRLALSIGVPLVFFGGVELGLRLVGYSPRGPVSLGFGSGDPILDISENDPDLLWRLVPNRELVLGNLRIRLNDAGLRGGLPPLERSAKSLRIVCVGDSTAFGNYTSYPAELESILAQANPDTTVEVVNGGVPGHSAAQGLVALKRDLLRFRPDIVTWCFGFNNAKDAMGGRSDSTWIEAARSSHARYHRILRQSRFVAWLDDVFVSGRMEPTVFNSGTPVLRVDPQAHAGLVREAARLCAESGARFVVIEQPHAYGFDDDSPEETEWDWVRAEPLKRLTEQNAVLARACADSSIPFVTTQEEYSRRNLASLFVGPLPGGDAIHTSALGLRMFAEILATELARRGLVSIPTESVLAPSNYTRPAFAVADLERDGSTSLFAASIVDGHVDLSQFDPATGSILHHVAPIAPPTRGCSLSTLPLLPGQYLVSFRGRDQRIRFASRFMDGTPGAFKTVSVNPVPGVDWIRIVPVDLEGDGRPEFAAELGPRHGPGLPVLNENGSMLMSIPYTLDSMLGISVSAFPHPRSDRSQLIALSGAYRGDPVTILFGEGFAPPRAIGAAGGPVDVPFSVHPLRLVDGTRVDIELHGAVGFARTRDNIRPVFPWGSTAEEFDGPRIGIATGRTESGTNDAVIVASLTGEGLTLARFDTAGWTRLPKVESKALEGP